jgi:hypothetical protein
MDIGLCVTINVTTSRRTSPVLMVEHAHPFEACGRACHLSNNDCAIATPREILLPTMQARTTVDGKVLVDEEEPEQPRGGVLTRRRMSHRTKPVLHPR